MHVRVSASFRPRCAALRPPPSLLLRLPSRWRHQQRAAVRDGAVAGDEATREAYRTALAEVGDDIDPDVVDDIKAEGLGRRRGALTAKAALHNRSHACHAQLIGTVLGAHDPLPARPAKLPEVALVGRSNSGKSSLLNALCGTRRADGAASVSATPGWTTSIQFFELREAPPPEPALMTLVDLPGYGPAAVGTKVRQRWARAAKQYLSSSDQLACAFLLIDAALGVTADDEGFLDVLERAQAPFHGVLTKADLLSPLELAQSYELVRRRVATRAGYAGGDLPIVSSRNAAGVASLWERMRLGALHKRSELEREEEDRDDDSGTISSGAPRGRLARGRRRLRSGTRTTV